MNRRILWTVVVAGGSFVGGVTVDLLSGYRSTVIAQSGSPLPPRPAPVERAKVVGPERFDEIVRRIGPAVVAVDAVKTITPTAPKSKAKSEEESGSGVIVRFDGFRGCYAVTNNHVVDGARAGDVTATLADGRILVAERVLVDPASDVAILKLPADDLPTAPLGDSDRMRVGHWVLAFGSPFGLNQTVTHGIISARDRGQISLGNTIRIKEFLQTDAAINPGSSGGPLVDLAGSVIGINTAIASNNGSNSGVSFSIPSNLVRRLGRELLEKGVVSRGYLGMQLSPTLEPSAALRLGLTRAWGALVESVHPGGPAAIGGVRAGDVVLKLDTVEVRDENHLINLIGSLPIGQRVRVTVWRDRQTRTLDVAVGDWAAAVGRNR